MNDNKVNNVPLVAFSRGDYQEGLHRGSIAVVASDGRLLASVGDPGLPVLIRSCAKPFQLVSVLESGAVEKFGISEEELAVAAASHSGEEFHIRTVESLLRKINMAKDSLRCGAHPPLMPHVVARMAISGAEPEPLTNNCSGKHSAMLAACLAKGWTVEDYESPSHPLQVKNHEVTAEFVGLHTEDVGVAIDGCNVPTFGMPLSAAALGYARIADFEMAPKGYSEHARRVFNAMNKYPYHGSGKIGRLEGLLMHLFPEEMIVKIGAEGYFAIGISPGLVDEYGVGIAVKLEDGITFNRGADAVVVAVLKQMGLLDQNKLKMLEPYFPADIRNCRDKPVGKIDILFNLIENKTD